MAWTIEKSEKIKIIYQDEVVGEVERTVTYQEFIQKIKEIARQLGISRFNLYYDDHEVLPQEESIREALENAHEITIVKADTAG